MRQLSEGKGLLALVALYVLVYLLPLGVRPLTTPDETRYAEIPREMIASGDWIAPRLDGLRYFEKPPLGYWITALAIVALGENAYAVRLPSALAVGVSALLLFQLVRRCRGTTRAAVLTPVILLTSLEVFAVGITNVLDSLLSCLLTGAMVAFFVAVHEERPRRRGTLLGVCGALCGLAFLTKGLLAFAVPVTVAVPYLVWQRRWRAMLTLPWLPVLTAIGVTLPWAVAVHLREPDFWRYFFWVEHVQRFFSPMGAALHAEPLWFYLPFLVGGMIHWVPLLPAAISGLRQSLPVPIPGSLVRFSVCWLAGPLLLFSASSGKLATYILPCFPPIAVLLGVGLDRAFSAEKRRLLAVGAAISGGIAGATAAFILVTQLTGWQSTHWYGADERWKWVLVTSAFSTWAILGLRAASQMPAPAAIGLHCAAPVAFMLAVSFVIPDSSGEGKMPGRFLRAQAQHLPPSAHILSDEYLVHAVCWYLGRADISLVDKGGELSYGLRSSGSSGRLFTVKQMVELVLSPQRTHEVVVIADADSLRAWTEGGQLARLPQPAYRADDDGFVVAVFPVTEDRAPRASRTDQGPQP